jgi:hypothetical protein
VHGRVHEFTDYPSSFFKVPSSFFELRRDKTPCQADYPPYGAYPLDPSSGSGQTPLRIEVPTLLLDPFNIIELPASVLDSRFGTVEPEEKEEPSTLLSRDPVSFFAFGSIEAEIDIYTVILVLL